MKPIKYSSQNTLWEGLMGCATTLQFMLHLNLLACELVTKCEPNVFLFHSENFKH